MLLSLVKFALSSFFGSPQAAVSRVTRKDYRVPTVQDARDENNMKYVLLDAISASIFLDADSADNDYRYQ